jgi:hypothetical protein
MTVIGREAHPIDSVVAAAGAPPRADRRRGDSGICGARAAVEGWCVLEERDLALWPEPSERSTVHTVVGPVPRASPLEARGRPLSRLVGRARELASLEDLWAQAKTGRGQVVGIVGEPGRLPTGRMRGCPLARQRDAGGPRPTGGYPCGRAALPVGDLSPQVSACVGQ